MPDTAEPEIRYDIGCGLSTVFLSQDVETYDESEMDVIVGRTWQLRGQGDETLAERYIKDGGTRADVVREFLPDIIREVGDAKAEWIRIQNDPKPEEIPPWERTERTICLSPQHTPDDDGDAFRFEDECRGWLVFDRSSEQWYSWRTNHWEPANEDVGNAARFVGRSVMGEIKGWEGSGSLSDSRLADYKRHAKNAANLSAQRAMLTLARTRMTVDMPTASNRALLACKNGIVDTRSGKFYPLWECDQFRYEYPTIYVDCEYTPGNISEQWVEHLLIVMSDNTTEGLREEERENRKFTLTAYLLRLFGYALYPGNPERIFVFFWGKGRNGKSKTMDVLQNILGTQAARAALAQLYASDTDRAAPSVADALPARLAIFSEADGEAPVSTSAFKELTGEEFSSRWRKMHANNVRLPIYCLPIGTTNDIPQFDKAVDQALLNRVITVPFKHTFPQETSGVAQRILTERDAIFSMMVDQLRAYITEGLPEIPQCARATQQELLAGEDMYQYFTRALLPGDGPDDTMTRQELKDDYLRWCELHGVDVDTRSVRDSNENGETVYRKVLTKGQTVRLFNAARVMGIREVTIHGKRCFRVRRIVSEQTTLC